MEDVILQYTYPRIDAEVSKHRNHLLKSPFVVHPGTGRVCVPVNPALAEEFDPETVPTVGELLHELNGIPAESEEAKGRKMEGGLILLCILRKTGPLIRDRLRAHRPQAIRRHV
jgi:DNA primase small subunit